MNQSAKQRQNAQHFISTSLCIGTRVENDLVEKFLLSNLDTFHFSSLRCKDDLGWIVHLGTFFFSSLVA